jgi:hypothetical protein
MRKFSVVSTLLNDVAPRAASESPSLMIEHNRRNVCVTHVDVFKRYLPILADAFNTMTLKKLIDSMQDLVESMRLRITIRKLSNRLAE